MQEKSKDFQHCYEDRHFAQKRSFHLFLNWKPTFIDEVQPVNVKTIRDLTTGGMMLTSDENMVQVEINVQYVPSAFITTLVL